MGVQGHRIIRIHVTTARRRVTGCIAALSLQRKIVMWRVLKRKMNISKNARSFPCHERSWKGQKD